jgi:hypothetical protein
MYGVLDGVVCLWAVELVGVRSCGRARCEWAMSFKERRQCTLAMASR